MSAPDTIGTSCVKKECEGTEYTCCCKTCVKEESFTRGISTNLPIYDEYTLERLNE